MTHTSSQTRILCFPFGFRARVRRGRQRVGRDAVFQDVAPLVIEGVAEAVEQAYVIEEGRGRHRRCFEVLRYRHRLWWPLQTQDRGEHQILEDALAGEINLFGENLLLEDPPTVEQDLVTWFESDERDHTLAQMQGKCADLLLVDERLFAAGGIPMAALISRKFRIVSTGADRSGRPLLSGLAVQPGRHGLFQTDYAISAGKFWDPTKSEFDQAYRRSRQSEDVRPKVYATSPTEIDLFEVRLDAAFRLLDAALLIPFDAKKPKQFHDLCALFERALVPGADLNRRRITAAHACLRVFGSEWFDDMFPGCGKNILNLIEVAAASRGLTPEQFPEVQGTLSAEDDAGLCSISCSTVAKPRSAIAAASSCK